LQFAADALLVSVFIHVTGGIASNYSSLYVLPIIAAAIIRYRRVAVQVATLSAVLYLPSSPFSMAISIFRWRAVSLRRSTCQRCTSRNTPWRSILAASSRSRCSLVRWPTACDRRGPRLEDASLVIRDLRAYNEYVINSLLSGLIHAPTTNGAILTFNRAAGTIIGLPSSHAVGREVMDVMQLPASVRGRLTGLSEGAGCASTTSTRRPRGASSTSD
jgi:PAS domain-containing protein